MSNNRKTPESKAPSMPNGREPPANSDRPGRPAATWLARWPFELVMGVVVVVCLALDVQAAPVLWVLKEGWWGPVAYVAVGSILAQPALLGVWAVLGPQRAAIRWSCSLTLEALVWWADLLGEGGGWSPNRSQDQRDSNVIHAEDAAFMLGVFVGLFLAVQIPLGVARRFWQWRVRRPAIATERGSRQFSLRQVLGWTAFLAILLGASRYLVLHRTWELHFQIGWPQMRDIAFYIGFVTRSLLPLLLPVIALAGVVLGERRRGTFMLAATICAICGAALSVVQIADQNASVRWRDGFLEELGFCGTTIAVLTVMRCCGFRLAPFDERAK
jgi:hypothetical protein